MSDADWDADDFEPAEAGVETTRTTDKWEGEDEDDDVKDNWDDEDEGEKKEETQMTAVQKKKKRPLKEILAEKEAKRLEDQRKMVEEKEEAEKAKTPAAIAEAKERARRMQEEADLKLAKEAFGVQDEYTGDSIDNASPVSKDEFNKLQQCLKNKILQFEKSAHYLGFLEGLFSDISLSLEADDLKKISSSLTAITNEKLKQQKAAAKGKKKKSTPKLTMSRGDGLDDYAAAEYDGFDDFI